MSKQGSSSARKEKTKDEKKRDRSPKRLRDRDRSPRKGREDKDQSCHTPIPGPTRMADPNRVRGVRLYTGTLYLFFFFFSSELNLYLWVYKQFP